MKYLLALLTFFSVACFGSDYTVHPDAGFPPDLLVAARGAAADWAANVPVKFAFAADPCTEQRDPARLCLHVVERLPEVPWQPGELAGFSVLSDIWLAGPILEQGSAAYRQAVIAHELGHSMGLLHTGPGTLMYQHSNVGGSKVVTPADVAQWRAVRGIQ